MKLVFLTVRFKRSVNCPLEAGVIIEGHGGTNIIIDMMARPVYNVWYFVDDHEMDITWTPGPFKERVAK